MATRAGASHAHALISSSMRGLAFRVGGYGGFWLTEFWLSEVEVLSLAAKLFGLEL